MYKKKQITATHTKCNKMSSKSARKATETHFPAIFSGQRTPAGTKSVKIYIIYYCCHFHYRHHSPFNYRINVVLGTNNSDVSNSTLLYKDLHVTDDK